MTKKRILTMEVDITNLAEATHYLGKLGRENQSSYVCVSNVHMCIETLNDEDFRSVVNNADLVVPDGRPIYWAQKILGASSAKQVRGMDLTNALVAYAEANGISVGFYGGAESTLNILQKKLKQAYKGLDIAYAYSPPFRELSATEKDDVTKAVNDSGIGLLFVGLGCPKQERWMAEHKDQVNAVMLGVGAAFDFIAGNKKHAPVVLQSLGLEWLYRLLSEPKRLWRRYLSTNPKFFVCFFLQALGKKF